MKNRIKNSIRVIIIAFFILFPCATFQQTQSKSKDAWVYMNRGNEYLERGEYDQAVLHYNMALEINPRLAGAYYYRGAAYEKKAQHDLAISDFTKTLELKPRDARAYYYRGLVYEKKGQYDQAMSDYTKLIELDPKNPASYNTLAWFFATAKTPGFRNGKKAVELAQKACELSDWKNPNYLDTLAAAYARAGDFGIAIKWQEKALESHELPNRTEVQQRLNLYRGHKPWPAD